MPPAVLERGGAQLEISDPKHKGDALFEVVQGEVVKLPNMSAHSGDIANEISIELAIYARQRGMGKTLTEVLFRIPTKSDASNQRRPDVAFLSVGRWPLNKKAPNTDPWPAVPNLAVEVLSPTDRVFNVSNKIVEYFEAGVELVWIVDPNQETVTVYTAPRKHTELTKSDILDGGSVIPGFSLPLVQLFR